MQIIINGSLFSTKGTLIINSSLSSIVRHMLREDFLDIFQAFYQRNLDLSRFKKAFIVLLPKSARARGIGDFKPISLISSIFKIISEVLTTKLKSKIDSLINRSQSTFIRGRSILDSVASAQEIVYAGAKNHWPAYFLKLDFTKAFNTLEGPFYYVRYKLKG